MTQLPRMTSRMFVEMLRECGITHLWLIRTKPPKGYRPGIDQPPNPTVRFINLDENRFVSPPAFLAAFTSKGPYAEKGRQINELKATIYDLEALRNALSAKWRDEGKE